MRVARLMLLVGLCCGGRLLAQLPAGTSSSATETSRTAMDPAEARLRAEASAALERSDFPAALTALKALAARHPEEPRLRFDLASTEDALEQNSVAEADYRKTIELDRAYLEPHLGLGLLLARTGQTAEARAELTTASAMTNGLPELRARAYRALARLDAADNPAAASEALLAALKLSPESPDDTLLTAELAERAGDATSAEAAYRRYLTSSANEPAATAALAGLLAKQGKAAEAEVLLNKALGAHAGDPAMSAQLAAIYERKGDTAKALALLEPLHAAHPEEASLGRLYARLLATSGDYAAAEPLLAKAHAAAPDDGGLADDEADALIHLKRFAEAEGVLKPVVTSKERFSSNEAFGEAASHLAFAASQNNDPETILHALSLRATVLPQSPASLFLEAIARDKLHQTKEARSLYQQFLSAAGGKFPDEEWEARHRLLALEHTH